MYENGVGDTGFSCCFLAFFWAIKHPFYREGNAIFVQIFSEMKFLIVSTLFFVIACRKKQDVPQEPPPILYTAPKIDSSNFRLGNLEKGTLDTFTLNYNRPVTVNYIRLLSELCLPNLRWNVEGGGKTVKFFDLLCGRLTEDFKFEISVKDSTGKDKMDSVTFSYYYKKTDIPGIVHQLKVSFDNKFCWVVAHDPNKLYCFGIEDTSYRREYNLPFKPGRFAFNRQNQRMYLLPYFYNISNLDRIYVFNPVSGVIEKTITVSKDLYDDPLNRIVISNIDFGANGYGVINTGTVETGPSRWRIIDSRANDTIYAHPEWIASLSGGNSNFREFTSIQPNYNGTKIYMQAINAYPRAGILDCQTKALTELTYASSNHGHYIIPSKSHDKLFVASFSFQAILTGNASWGTYSTFDNRYSETADFSYKPGEQDVVYYRGRNFSYDFSVLDYANSRILTRINVRPDFTNINATTDGKYIIVKSGNGICFLKTEMIYRSM